MTTISIPLDDSRLKEIAEVITNKTCITILNYLSDNEKTTSEISSELKLQINTVDYNIKKLLKTGLIEKKSYWWSVKGKKMPSYTVSNKQIIILPNKKMSNLKYLFAFGITGIASIFIKYFSQRPKIVYDRLSSVAGNGVEILATKTMDSIVQQTNISSITYFPTFGFAFWFLIGAWSMILLFFMFNIINERRNIYERK